MISRRPRRQEVVASSQNGSPGRPPSARRRGVQFIKDNQKATVNARNSRPVNVVRKATLGEISFVDLGANGPHQRDIAARQNKEPASRPTIPPTPHARPRSSPPSRRPEQVAPGRSLRPPASPPSARSAAAKHTRHRSPGHPRRLGCHAYRTRSLRQPPKARSSTPGHQRHQRGAGSRVLSRQARRHRRSAPRRQSRRRQSGFRAGWACRNSCSRPPSPTVTRAARSVTAAACSRPRSVAASRPA